MRFSKIELFLSKKLVKKMLKKDITQRDYLLSNIDEIIKQQEITDSNELKRIYELKDYISNFGKETS